MATSEFSREVIPVRAWADRREYYWIDGILVFRPAASLVLASKRSIRSKALKAARARSPTPSSGHDRHRKIRPICRDEPKTGGGECYLNASRLTARWPSSMDVNQRRFLRRLGDRYANGGRRWE